MLPGGERAIILKAYFDASERKSGFFCVAGYAFAQPQARKFEREWWELFGKYGGCHMKELTHPQLGGRFSGLNTTQTGELLKAGIAAIKRRFSFAAVVSCQLGEIHDLLPTWMDGFQHAYPVCCHMAMHTLGTLINDADTHENVAYFFESGDAFSDAAHRFMNLVETSPELKRSFSHESHTFISKSHARPLEAADVLAWEWAKYMDETRDAKRRPMRKSLAALMSDKGDFDKRYRGIHLTGDPLKIWCQRVESVGLLQVHEDMLTKGAYKT
jgi:hypothetical protein